MNWYLKVVRDNYFNFDGRARREEYWMFILFHILISIAFFGLPLIGMALENEIVINTGITLFLLYSIGTLIPRLAVIARRLHDQNKSGLYYLVTFIPLIGGIWLFILLVTEGTRGGNKYGPDPKKMKQNHFIEDNSIGDN